MAKALSATAADIRSQMPDLYKLAGAFGRYFITFQRGIVQLGIVYEDKTHKSLTYKINWKDADVVS